METLEESIKIRIDNAIESIKNQSIKRVVEKINRRSWSEGAAIYAAAYAASTTLDNFMKLTDFSEMTKAIERSDKEIEEQLDTLMKRGANFDYFFAQDFAESYYLHIVKSRLPIFLE